MIKIDDINRFFQDGECMRCPDPRFLREVQNVFDVFVSLSWFHVNMIIRETDRKHKRVGRWRVLMGFLR